MHRHALTRSDARPGGPGCLQANAPPAILAARMLADQVHAGAIERIDDLGQRFHHAADVAVEASIRWIVGSDTPASSAKVF